MFRLSTTDLWDLWSFSWLDSHKTWGQRFPCRIWCFYPKFGWIGKMMQFQTMHVALLKDFVLMIDRRQWRQDGVISVPNNINIFLLYHSLKNYSLAFKALLISDKNNSPCYFRVFVTNLQIVYGQRNNFRWFEGCAILPFLLRCLVQIQLIPDVSVSVMCITWFLSGT